MAFAQPVTKSNCNKVCPMVLKPVCGSDGNTYGNPCMFDNANCKAGGKLTSKPGKCAVGPVGTPSAPTQGNCPPGQHLVVINPNRCIKPGGPCTKVGTRSVCKPIDGVGGSMYASPKTPPPRPSCPPGQYMVDPNHCPPGANCSLIVRGPSYCAPFPQEKTCPPGQYMVDPNYCPPGTSCSAIYLGPSYCAPITTPPPKTPPPGPSKTCPPGQHMVRDCPASGVCPPHAKPSYCAPITK